jgi:hypothetical protein
MTMRLRKRTRDQWDDPDYVARDGDSIRVPLHLADAFRIENRRRFGELAGPGCR